MANYFNQINLNINEVSTLVFNHVVNINNKDEVSEVARLVTTFEHIIGIHQFLGNIIEKHKETLTQQREANKKLS